MKDYKRNRTALPRKRWAGIMNMTKEIICLVLFLPVFTGCAQLATQMGMGILNSSICQKECTSNSPETDKKCYSACMRKRDQERREFENKQEKDRTDKQIEAVTKGYRPLIK
jgi:hypothetical protein